MNTSRVFSTCYYFITIWYFYLHVLKLISELIQGKSALKTEWKTSNIWNSAVQRWLFLGLQANVLFLSNCKKKENSFESNKGSNSSFFFQKKNPDFLRFEEFYYFSRTLHQICYNLVKKFHAQKESQHRTLLIAKHRIKKRSRWANGFPPIF